VRRRLVLLLLVALALPAPASSAGSSWARSEIALVTSRGLFPGTAAEFRPAQPLTRAALSGLVARLSGLRVEVKGPSQRRPVSVATLDASLVDALGLEPAARALQLGARRAGLDPSRRFGTEVVARLLGLRDEHPASEPALSLRPNQAATRAEAAYSAARLLQLGEPPAGVERRTGLTAVEAAEQSGAVAYVNEISAGFRLPRLSVWQRRVLRTAVAFVGYPYFWGGDDEATSPGFDCSGLVLRVYKLARYAGAPRLAATLRGRSAATMSAVPNSERVGRRQLAPGDVLFFGAGPRSSPAEIDHTAIYLGDGWLIEASSQGVSLGELAWFGSEFAWARRPLAQAGLAPAPQAAGRQASRRPTTRPAPARRVGPPPGAR
jgi:cell wall-associated NlpC family hydrolase